MTQEWHHLRAPGKIHKTQNGTYRVKVGDQNTSCSTQVEAKKWYQSQLNRVWKYQSCYQTQPDGSLHVKLLHEPTKTLCDCFFEAEDLPLLKAHSWTIASNHIQSRIEKKRTCFAVKKYGYAIQDFEFVNGNVQDMRKQNLKLKSKSTIFRVMSLFDGCACAYEALQRNGIKPSVYYASEVDEVAQKVALQNHPDIVCLGDVTKIDFRQYEGKVDLLIGGSPCQGFSVAGKQLNFDDPRSKLFFEFVKAYKEVKPRYVLLENVQMKPEYVAVISEQIGLQPITIDANLVSAQNRIRLYWTNIPRVSLPLDRHVTLFDILDAGHSIDDSKQYVFQDDLLKAHTLSHPVCFNRVKENRDDQQDVRVLVPRTDLKVNCVTTTTNNSHLIYDGKRVRRLTPTECERLQGLPTNYTAGVPDTQRIHMIGNGFCVPVIAHILSFIPDPHLHAQLPQVSVPQVSEGVPVH